MPAYQKTVKDTVEFDGPGLFTGETASIRVRPAPPDTGLVFIRTDLPNRPRLEVTPENVHSGFRNVVLGEAGMEIETVEHLLSALYGLGIDNAEIDVSGREIPAGDGSSRVFVDLLQKAGRVDQSEVRRELVISEPISIVESASSIVALPGEEGLTISCSIDYENPVIGRQHVSLKISDQIYANEISPARTFCLRSEADQILKLGLGTGATPQNTIVVDTDRILETKLRFQDEFVRHKVLDLIGDLAPLGASVRGHIVAVKSGHKDNLKLIRRLAQLGEEPALRRKAPETLLDVRELFKVLPHRYPFLLIDKVIELDGYRKAIGVKNVTINEPFFQGHFPKQPIMPGVLILEAMAQLAGAMLMRKSENAKRLPVLLSLDNVKLRKMVIPGDQLRIETETLKLKSRTGEVYGRALVDGQIAAEANMKFMIIDQENF